MNTNLINNYINIQKSKTTNCSDAPNFAAKSEQFDTLSNRTYIKPLEGKGHLVKNSLLDTPAIIAKSVAYDIKSLKKGLNGESNDHQLGKLNDLGTKLGGLAIASYLFTKKSTPMTKAMEFVGFGSFFGAMALWPKIALQTPARLIHGFDIQKKYEDSQGRKKSFYQDPQYIPWDLYSEKQIEKIGNRLGVDKNLPNRREFVQEKMKKIALQNNTMWMLTAGFATPIMSGLICNQAEKFILKRQDLIKNKKTDNVLEKVNHRVAQFDDLVIKQAAEPDYITARKQLDGFIELNRDQPLTKKSIAKLTEIISPRLDPLMKKSVKADLEKMFLDKPAVVLDETADVIINGITSIFDESGLDKNISAKLIPTREEILDSFKTALVDKKDGEGLTKTELFKLRASLMFSINDKADAINNFDIDDIKLTTDKVFDHIDNALKQNTSSTVSPKTVEKIVKVATLIKDYSTKVSVLDEYARTKVAKSPETVLANSWNDISGSLIKLFNINEKEIKNVRHDRIFIQNLLRDKIETLASCSDEEYALKVKTLSVAVSKIDDKIKPEQVKLYHDKVTSVFDKAATSFGEINMPNSAQRLTAFNVGGKGSLKRLQHAFFDERIAGVKNTFYRLINTVDLYRRIAKGNFGGDNGPLNNAMKLEVRHEIIELSKQMTLQGHSSDHSIKFYFNRNPNPSNTTGAIKVENGKVFTESVDTNGKTIKNFYTHQPENGVDVSWDSNFYKNSMKFMYENEMDETTKSSLGQNLLGDLKAYRQAFFEKIGDADYFSKPAHKTMGGSTPAATSEEKFLLTGLAPDEMLTKVIKNTYHTNKWLKTFGYAAAALTAVTVTSQFFFGKMSNPKKANKG